MIILYSPPLCYFDVSRRYPYMTRSNRLCFHRPTQNIVGNNLAYVKPIIKKIRATYKNYVNAVLTGR